MGPFATQGMDLAGNGAGGRGRETDLSILWDGVEKLPRGPSHPLARQSRSRGQAATAVRTGLLAVPKASTGSPGCHQARCPSWLTPPWPVCGAGTGASSGRAGGGRQKMNEGVGRLMALSGK